MAVIVEVERRVRLSRKFNRRGKEFDTVCRQRTLLCREFDFKPSREPTGDQAWLLELAYEEPDGVAGVERDGKAEVEFGVRMKVAGGVGLQAIRGLLFFDLDLTYSQPWAFSMCCLQFDSRFDVYAQGLNRHLNSAGSSMCLSLT